MGGGAGGGDGGGCTGGVSGAHGAVRALLQLSAQRCRHAPEEV